MVLQSHEHRSREPKQPDDDSRYGASGDVRERFPDGGVYSPRARANNKEEVRTRALAHTMSETITS